MRHGRGKEFDFFWQRSMRNALEAKERFPKLKHTFSTVLLKEKCSLLAGGTGYNGCVDVMEDKCSHGYIFSNGTLLPKYSKL